MYDTPTGVGGKIDTKTGNILSGQYQGYKALNSSTISSAPQIQVPPTPTLTNPAPTVAGGNATLTQNGTALTTAPPSYDATTGKVTDYGKSTGLSDSSTTQTTPSILDTFKTYLGSLTPPPSGSDQYNTDYQNAGIDTKQTQYNNDQGAVKTAQAKLAGINAQLAGLNAEGQAMNLQQDGRQAPMSQITGQQAENNRQTAIRTLPLQAQALGAQAEVAAAQGNAQLSQSILQQAQDHLDKVFQIHQTDATNQYNYQTNLIDKVYQFVTTQEQTKLNDQKATLASQNTQYNAFINDVRAISASATQNGQSDIATKIATLAGTLDPNSKTFTQDFKKVNDQLSTLQGQIKGKTSNQIIGSADTGYTNVVTDANGKVISSTPIEQVTGGNAKYSFTPTVKTSLAGAGNTSSNISQLEKDIGAHGAQYVLDNGQMDPATQKVIETEFGITKTQPKGKGLFGLGILGL